MTNRFDEWHEIFDAKYEALAADGLSGLEASILASEWADEQMVERDMHRADMESEERRVA